MHQQSAPMPETQQQTGYRQYEDSDRRQLLDDKVAQSEGSRYNEREPHSWVIHTRNYVIGRANDGKEYLQWAEDRKHQPITEADVYQLRTTYSGMSDIDPIKFSRQRWGYLNLAVPGEARNIFNNVEP